MFVLTKCNLHSISYGVKQNETAALMNVFINELIRAVDVKNPSTLPPKEKKHKMAIAVPRSRDVRFC